MPVAVSAVLSLAVVGLPVLLVGAGPAGASTCSGPTTWSALQTVVNGASTTSTTTVKLCATMNNNGAGELTLPQFAAVVLDLNGYSLTITAGDAARAAIGVISGSTFTLQDSSANSTGTLTVTGNGGGAGLGSDQLFLSGTVTITGGSVSAMGGPDAAGLGSGASGANGEVRITGGTVTAHGGVGAAGIGGGWEASGHGGSSGTITVDGGMVTAIGGDEGAGIGGGYGDGANGGAVGTVAINGGTVAATGGYEGAGIGTGRGGFRGDVAVNGGAVTATGGNNAAGIGDGYTGFGGSLSIGAGAVVSATGGPSSNRAVGGTYYGTLTNSGSLTLGSNQVNDGSVNNTATGVIHVLGSYSHEQSGQSLGSTTNDGAILLDGGYIYYGDPTNQTRIYDHGFLIGYSTDPGGTAATEVFASSFAAARSSVTGNPVLNTPPPGASWYSAQCGGVQVTANTDLGSVFGNKTAAWSSVVNGVLTPNVILYAETPQTVTFNSEGGTGSSPTTETVLQGCTATQPTAPTLANYTFDGWFTAASGGTQYDFTTPVTADTTLYAQWTGVPETVTFNSEGGSAVGPQTVAYGSTATAPTAPTRTGYSFVSWSTTADGSSGAYDFSTAVTGNLALYAQWTPNQETVSFNSEGGSAVGSETVSYGSAATAPTAPTRTGYLFVAWSTTAAGSSGAYDFSTAVTGNLALYAQWTPNQEAVSFNSEGGSSVGSQTVSYGSAATAPTAPTRTGYSFVGWSTSADGSSGAYDFSTAVTGNLTLYAQWTPNQETVSFNSQGGSSVASESVSYGSAATAPTAPTRTGYLFVAWSTTAAGSSGAYDFSTPVTGNVTLYAQWAATAPRISGASGSVTYGVTSSGLNLTYGSTTTDPLTVSANGLPAGLTLVDNRNGTATVSGSPTAAAGSYPVTYTVTDTSNGAFETASGTITVGKGTTALTQPSTLTSSAAGPTTLTATLSQPGGTGDVSGKTVTFKVINSRGKVVATIAGVTGQSGKVSVTAKLTGGTYTYTVAFAGDAYFQPSTTTKGSETIVKVGRT